MIEAKTTYGVYWKTKLNPDNWEIFSAWFTSYEAAKEEAKLALRNPRHIEVKVVERVETFKPIDEKQ